MTKINKALLLAICLSLVSCAWLKANSKALDADGLALVGCAVSNAQAGLPVETVATNCGITLVSDAVNILDAAAVKPVSSPGLILARQQIATKK